MHPFRHAHRERADTKQAVQKKSNQQFLVFVCGGEFLFSFYNFYENWRL